jgi:hypothetical protein
MKTPKRTQSQTNWASGPKLEIIKPSDNLPTYKPYKGFTVNAPRGNDYQASSFSAHLSGDASYVGLGRVL